ncbi:hypothetical protein [Azospirillum melinis]
MLRPQGGGGPEARRRLRQLGSLYAQQSPVEKKKKPFLAHDCPSHGRHQKSAIRKNPVGGPAANANHCRTEAAPPQGAITTAQALDRTVASRLTATSPSLSKPQDGPRRPSHRHRRALALRPGDGATHLASAWQTARRIAKTWPMMQGRPRIDGRRERMERTAGSRLRDFTPALRLPRRGRGTPAGS